MRVLNAGSKQIGSNVNYKLSELLDVPRLQALLDSLDEIYSTPSAIIDMDGNILTATAWQDICTKFHRVNPECEKECIISDTYIAGELSRGQHQVRYKCPHGLIDTATPIVVDGMHVGNAFTGQLFLEPPNEIDFRKAAKKYGFDEDAYIAALRKVPIVSEERLEKTLKVLSHLTEMLADQGLRHKKQLEVERALNDARKTYGTIFRHSQSVMLLINPETAAIEDANEEACKYYGYSLDEIRKHKITDMNTLSPEEVQAEMRSARDRGHAHFNFRHRLANGEIRDVEVYSSPVTIKGRSLLYSIVHDVTERKRVEEALRESESRIRSIGNNLPTGMLYQIIRNKDGSRRMSYVSEAVRRFYGCSPQEAMADPGLIYGRVFEADRHRLWEEEEAAFNSFSNFSTEARIIDPSGSIRWSSFASSPRMMEDGSSCWDGIEIDITGRRQADNKLRESEERFRTIMDSLDALVYVADMETYEILFINAYGVKLFGEVEGGICWKALQEKQDGPCQFCTNKYLLDRNGNPNEAYVWEFQNTVTGRWLAISDKAIRWVDGRTVRLEIAKDITEIKKIEAELKASNETKTMLMREVHHRVKNNLAVIQSLIHLQMQDIEDEKSKGYFADISNRVKSMTMIHEMLHKTDNISRLGCSAYMHNFVETLFLNYKIKPNHIKPHFDIDDIELHVDTMIPLGLIVNELVSNALKYAFPDDRTGDLSISLKKRGDSLYELVVRDTGIGLPENFDIENINSLGLVIVSTLVKQIGGELEIYNDDGAKFSIVFRDISVD